MGDGTMAKARRLPKRAPDEDYTYTYMGVKTRHDQGSRVGYRAAGWPVACIPPRYLGCEIFLREQY